MSQPFTFPPPPPPPPPPKPTSNLIYPSNTSPGGQIRGANFQGGAGRGRGQFSGRGNFRRGNSSYEQGNSHYRKSDIRHAQSFQTSNSPSQSWKPQQNTRAQSGQKRNHTTAFHNHADNALRYSRPSAPPAVPSFGIDLETLLSKRPEIQKSLDPPSTKKNNSLGLTPVVHGSDSEEDDEGEEAKLAQTSTSDSLLQFEYKGHTSTLSTSEDIAAWLAERRRKWPTEAKREEARREAEEKRRKWEEEKAKRLEASRTAARARQEEWQKKKLEKEKSQVRQKMLKEQILKAKTRAVETIPQTAAQMKAEKLRRKAEKIAQQLNIAEDALLSSDAAGTLDVPNQDVDLDILLAQVDKVAAAREPQTLDLSDADTDTDTETDEIGTSDANFNHVAHDDTSTSGSSSESDSDSDSGPEELTSKRTAPERIQPPLRKALTGMHTSSLTDMRPLCTNFAKTGRCKFGRRCHFRHPKPEPKGSLESSVGKRRKGLYQVMVEREQDEERKRALRAIIALGDSGLLGSDNQVSTSTDIDPSIALQ